MNAEQRRKLRELLTDLLQAQDSVTRTSEQGPAFQDKAHALVVKRNAIEKGIMAFVQDLTSTETGL